MNLANHTQVETFPIVLSGYHLSHQIGEVFYLYFNIIALRSTTQMDFALGTGGDKDIRPCGLCLLEPFHLYLLGTG